MIEIPRPCHKNWNNLGGNDRAKYCSLCKKHVYNLDQLSENQVLKLVKREGKLCGKMVVKHQSVSPVTRLRLLMVGFGLFVTNVFGQHDSIQIKGRVSDANGFPIMDSKITLKDFPIESFSNENGEFELKVPKNLKTYVLIAKESENRIEILYKEEELSQEIIIPLEHPEDLILGEIIYKPTFKQRVINTITWPYRKIRSTFFDD